MKCIPFALLLTVPSLSLRGEEIKPAPFAPDLARASVTIPYTELRALWEAAQVRPEAKPEPAPVPVPFLVHRADYRLQLGEETSTLDADFEVEAFSEKWETIPLLGGDVQLAKAETGERPLIWKDGYALLVKDPGKAQAALHFTSSGLKAQGASEGTKLRLPEATAKQLSVTGVAPGMEVRVNGRTAHEIKAGASIFHLASEAGEIAIQISAPKAEPPPKVATPSRWETESQVLVSYAEGRLLYESHLMAHAEDGSGNEIQLTVPPNAMSIRVLGDDVAGWSAVRTGDGRSRTIRVDWKTPEILDRELSLIYSVPQSPLAEQWNLQASIAPGQAPGRHLFAIVTTEGLELRGEGVQTAIGAHRLPQWMRKEIGGAAFVTVEGGPQLSLQTHWLDRMETAEATVTQAKGELRLVADGSMQAGATYQIRHSAPLAWPLELPKSVELLSCSIDGKAARPIVRQDGAIELSLAAPSSEKGVTTVALVYTSKTAALDPVSGKLPLEMPRTPLFIERLDWSVEIPEQFEITALEGNIAAAGGAAPSAGQNVIALRKDLCRGERPAVELFFQRRSLEK